VGVVKKLKNFWNENLLKNMLSKPFKPSSKETKEVFGFCEDCMYRGIDGGPGAVMICKHPSAPGMGYIISWVKYNGEEKRTPSNGKCPLRT